MKLNWLAACLLIASVLSGCKAANSEAWQRGKQYRWVAPKTGSNVGRWVAIEDDTPKPKRKKKTARAERKRTDKREPRDLTPAPPADRFR